MVLLAGRRTLVAKTCTKCGELKDAADFRLDKGHDKKTRSSWCDACFRVHTTATVDRYQLETLRKADKHHQEWTSSEIATLMVLRDDGFTQKEMALRLGRSFSGVANRCYQIRRAEAEEREWERLRQEDADETAGIA